LIGKIRQANRQFEQCPNDPDNSGPPVNADIIYRAAAVGGEALIPALRRISRPKMRPDSIPGAAQVSLARLGDKESLDQIAEELNGKTGSGSAPWKLGRVGNEKAVAILLNYFIARGSDISRYQPVAPDLGGDAMGGVVVTLSSVVQDPPFDPSGSVSGDPKIWTAWWEQNKGKPLALSISNDL
jgi:hypothetical protein